MPLRRAMSAALASAVLLGFPTLLPDENDRRFEELSPGRYRLWCSLEGHEALGMSTTLDVR